MSYLRRIIQVTKNDRCINKNIRANSKQEPVLKKIKNTQLLVQTHNEAGPRQNGKKDQRDETEKKQKKEKNKQNMDVAALQDRGKKVKK